MISFVLFEFTKQTFQTWLKTLIGYIIYPALGLAFISLMIVTFDSIFYGKPVNNNCTKTANCTIKDICGVSLSDNNSLYCVMALRLNDAKIKNASANFCSVRDGKITNLFASEDLITSFKNNTKVYFWQNALAPLAKMVLFAILFHKMMRAVLTFFETMLSVYGISSLTASASALGRSAASVAYRVNPAVLAFKAATRDKK
jgi:type IV secretion system protein VirB6